LITATLGVSSYPVRRIPLPIGTAPAITTCGGEQA
jgi:hypothetical protein